ncbi:MAG TPA: hypothetical protein VNG93_14450 [Candidatus Dormibacteraeota bacterium]|nr:hypothetical protein [Candidatus Dormibacteraeota bacterium]
MSAARRTRIAVLSSSLLVVVGLIGGAVFGLQVHQLCSYDPIGGFTSFALISVSIGGFVGGHLLTGWLEATAGPRDADDRSPQGHGIRARLDGAAGSSQARLAVQLALVLFLGLSVWLLAYEALALADTSANWPITYYVRCFTHANAWAAGIGALAICTLLGQWVWYPGG